MICFTVSQQTLKDVEVVISDHSVDTEIEEYCDENEYDLNIKYIRNVEARGNPAVNTNNAIDHSTGRLSKSSSRMIFCMIQKHCKRCMM